MAAKVLILGGGYAGAYAALAAARALDAHLGTLARGALVTVIGSGFTGLELATELADRFRVVLIERADVIAPSLGDGPRETIARALKDVGVEVRLGATLDRIEG